MKQRTLLFAPTPFGNSAWSMSWRDIPRIAQRFSVGLNCGDEQVPRGRLMRLRTAPHSAVPSGLGTSDNGFPTPKRWAIVACPSGTAACRLRRIILQKALRSGLWLACSLAGNAAEPWTLERCLDYALAHNPDARIAQHRITAAEAGLEQANSAFWPQLRVQSSYTRTDNPMTVFGNILNQRSYSSSLNFNDVPDVDDLNAPG